MMMRNAIVCLSIGLCSTVCADADPFKTCFDNAATTAAMHQCANQEFEFYDKKLNQIYQTLQSKVGSENKAALTEAQRAWVAFRDKECQFSSQQNAGGTIQPINLLGCYTNLTQKRITDLQLYISTYNQP